jgi:hypothetical protein
MRKTRDYLGRRASVRHNGARYNGVIASAEDRYDRAAGVWRVFVRVRANFPGNRGDEREFDVDAVDLLD